MVTRGAATWAIREAKDGNYRTRKSGRVLVGHSKITFRASSVFPIRDITAL
jgi:hypothetical protein